MCRCVVWQARAPSVGQQQQQQQLSCDIDLQGAGILAGRHLHLNDRDPPQMTMHDGYGIWFLAVCGCAGDGRAAGRGAAAGAGAQQADA